MLAEFVVGRGSERNPIDAFHRLGHGSWAVVGALGTFVAFWILSFYSVVGGWVLRYVYGSATGAYFGESADYFTSIAAGPEAIALHAVFMALTVAVVASGVEDGIETATKVMVPSIVALLLGLGVWAATLGGAGEGYAYYLDPDFGQLAGNLGTVLPDAVGQAFFTLSLGMGAMITYASYLGEDDSLPADGGAIVVLNTFVGVLAGFVVFPVLFSQGVTPGEGAGGAGAVFVTLAAAFAQLPVGRVLGVGFFLVLLLAALSSAISLLEVMVSYVTDHYRWDRPTAAAGFGVALFLFGVPSAMGTGILGWYNDVAYSLLLPLSVLGILLFVGWVDAPSSVAELRRGTGGDGRLVTAWLWFVRTVVVLGVLVTVFYGVFGDGGLLVEAGVLESGLP